MHGVISAKHGGAGDAVNWVRVADDSEARFEFENGRENAIGTLHTYANVANARFVMIFKLLNGSH